MNNDLTQVQAEIKPTITQLISDQATYDPFKDDVYITNGTFLLNRFSKMAKTIEDQRLSFTAPLNQSLKNINSFFKTFSAPVELANRELRDKLANHRKELEYKRLEAQMKVEEENRKKIEEAKAAGKPTENLVLNPVVVPDLNKTIGGVTVKKVWTFQIDDKTKVPQDYLVVDEAKIRVAIRQGIRQIAGVTIYQKDEVSL